MKPFLRRYFFLALGGVVLVVSAVGCGFQAAAAAPSATGPIDRPSAASAEPAEPEEPPSPGGVALPALVQPTDLADYRIIVERNLFRPTPTHGERRSGEKSEGSGTASNPPPAGLPAARPTRSAAPDRSSSQASGDTGSDQGTVPAPPDQARPNPGPPGNGSSASPAEEPKIVLTGFLCLGTGWRALLEDPVHERGELVSAGETAFGYRLIGLDPQQDRVTIEQEGRTYVLKLGNVEREEKDSRPSSSGSPPSAGAQPTPGLTSEERLEKLKKRFGDDLTPEMIERYREWEQRRYGY